MAGRALHLRPLQSLKVTYQRERQQRFQMTRRSEAAGVRTSLPTDWGRAAIGVHGDNTPKGQIYRYLLYPTSLLINFVYSYMSCVKNFFFHISKVWLKRGQCYGSGRGQQEGGQRAMSALGLDPDLPALLTSDQLDSAPLSQRGNEETNV